MLTAAQLSLHWNYNVGWARVCRANDWRMVDGRLCATAVRTDAGGWHEKVWAFARLVAQQEGRAVIPDDLRKGSYWLAIGSPKSLKAFGNGDLDRVLVLFKVLIEPTDLAAIQDLLAYQKFDQAKARIAECRRLRIPVDVELPDDPGERRRHLAFIRKTPEAVIARFARERFDGVLPEDLPLRELRNFTRTLKTRRAYDNRPVQYQPQRRVMNIEDVDVNAVWNP